MITRHNFCHSTLFFPTLVSNKASCNYFNIKDEIYIKKNFKVTHNCILFAELRETKQKLSTLVEANKSIANQLKKEKSATKKAREQHEQVLNDNRSKKLTIKSLRQELKIAQENNKSLEEDLEMLVQFLSI